LHETILTIDLSRYDNHEFDRGASRAREAFWWLVQAIVFQSRFPWPSRIKVVLLRLFGAQVGAGVVIRSRVTISFPWRLAIGNHVWMGDEVMILSLANVSIGSNVCISQRAFLCTGSHNHREQTFDLITKPIRIDDGAWVGAISFVGPGVTVGAGAVCAAGAIVVRDVPPGAVVGGNPAKLVGKEDSPRRP